MAGNRIVSVFDVIDLSVAAPQLKVLMFNDGVHGENPVSYCQNIQSLVIELFKDLERFDHMKISQELKLRVNATMLRKKL